LFAKSFKVIKVPVVNGRRCNFVADKWAFDWEKCVRECRKLSMERRKESRIKSIKRWSVEAVGGKRGDYEDGLSEGFCGENDVFRSSLIAAFCYKNTKRVWLIV
jgi:hypothetical protein